MLNINPYNYHKPVGIKNFIGRRPVLDKIINSIYEHSWCIINGDRLGKTSLLKAIESILLENQSEDIMQTPCFVDLMTCDTKSVENVYARFLWNLHETLSKQESESGTSQIDLSETRLQDFIDSKHEAVSIITFEGIIKDLEKRFESAYQQFMLVILLDEPESIILYDWSIKFFETLRALIYSGSLSNTIRLVLAASDNAYLNMRKTSPLIEVLEKEHLKLFDENDTRALIARGGTVSEDVFKEIQHQSGGHPFIIQYILHHLWQKNKQFEEARPEQIRDIAYQMINQRDADFRNWSEKIRHGGRKAYSMIANSKNGLDESSLRAQLLDHVNDPLDDLMSLCNSGLVIKDDQKRYRIAGHLFLNWFNEFVMPKVQQFTRSVPFYISSVVLKNIQNFNAFSTRFTNAEQATCLCSLFLGDNSAGKTSLLRSIVLGMCSENSSKMLLSHYEGMLIQKGQSQGSIKISLHHKENGTYIIVSLIKRISPHEEQLTRKYYKDSEQNEISPENFPKQDLFVCGYGAGRTQGDLAIDKIQHYSIFNAVGTLFNYNSPLKGPELSLRRLIDQIKHMNNARNGAAELDSLARDKTISIFQQAIENIFMFKDNEQLVLSSKGIEIIAQDGQTIPLHAHGDGYQNTAAWILDMISWSMSAKRSIAPHEISGIVIIDEIEQHLHPKWQRHLIQKLREQFPKIQFILTTHSPLCSSGAETSLRRSKTLIKKLNKTENGIECTDVKNIDGLKADQVLQSKAFELESTLNPEINKIYEEFAQMYIDDREDEDRFIELRQILEEKFPKHDFDISSMQLDRQKIMQNFKGAYL
jgi:predicted ATP-dependent endonuclease of OLD family